MTEKQFYDYEAEGGTGLMSPRNHLRNISKYLGFVTCPFQLTEANDLYAHPYDIYHEEKTNSHIWVIGGDAHCHVGEELGKYEEAIVLYCKPEDKENLIKDISKVV